MAVPEVDSDAPDPSGDFQACTSMLNVRMALSLQTTLSGERHTREGLPQAYGKQLQQLGHLRGSGGDVKLRKTKLDLNPPLFFP